MVPKNLTITDLEILRTENITKRYGDHLALSGVSLTIPKQSIFGLLGPNGAGKTTLIRIITQIIAADSGDVYIDDETLQYQHVSMIGYLPEERGLYKKMKVGEHLLYLAKLKGLSDREARKSIQHWLEKFDIDTWWNKKVEDLSKGMQQKVQFIATILHRPRIVILDEPFSGFDPINVNILKDEILNLRESGSTIIFSTHRMESVEELCDHIALINKAEKILEGPKEEIKETFKDQTYIIEHKGQLPTLNSGFNLVEDMDLGHDVFRSTIRIVDGGQPNDLIAALIDKVDIKNFNEKVPSMNEIFITKVKGDTGHE
jgi:ABC-2 type transport system ATP-binding protein